MKALRCVSVLAGAALLPGVALAQEVPLAIRGARIVTVSGPVIEKGTVVVQQGRIVAVGPDVPVPAGASVIDGSGKTLYPGLVDALTTIGLAEVSSVPATLDTTEVGDMNPHARAWVALHPDSELIPVARANGITTVLSAPAGG
ncbi:MAG TPA: amidohydrolase, partial [Vicinamibacteria bacterium]|nr:amidohydrolase [Vicinamibacteria bacterium]